MFDETPDEFEERLREKWSPGGEEGGSARDIFSGENLGREESEEVFRSMMEAYEQGLDELDPEIREHHCGSAAALALVKLKQMGSLIRQLHEKGFIEEGDVPRALSEIDLAMRSVMVLAAASEPDVEPEGILGTMVLLSLYGM